MKRSFYYILLLASIAVTLNSCLGDNDDYVYYDDAGIVSFSLTTANVYSTTISSDGKTTTTKAELKNGTYRFHIDQLKHEIYNPDSLPVGTDAKHILVSASAKMGGTLYLKSMTSDSVKVFNSNDSVDFSSPRTMIVVSHSGKLRMEYKVSVNIHKQEGNQMTWSAPAIAEPAEDYTEGMKIVEFNGRMYIFGSDGEKTEGCASDITDGKKWEPLTSSLSTPFDADAYKSLIVQGDNLYILSGGKVLSSPDGEDWSEVASTDAKQLLGATPWRMYALSADGMIAVSTDGGVTWKSEDIDGDAAMLPTTDISMCYNPLKTNPDAYQVIIVGRGDSETELKGRIWGKVEENSQYSQDNAWTSYGDYDGNKYPAPALVSMQAIAYDEGFVLFGGNGIGETGYREYSTFYKSLDGGLSWRTDNGMTLPNEFICTNDVMAMTVDSDNCIWIVCGASGQVWRGRLNKLGWEEYKQYYKE